MTSRTACVVGWPVSHSRSPLIHGHWLQSMGIEGSYVRMPVEPGGEVAFLARVAAGEFCGCNVTLPHKETFFAALSHVDHHARRLGVVNTVYRRNGRLHGTSTDGAGFLASVADSVPGWSAKGRKAVMFGAGGAARAIVGALLEGGAAEIAVVNRTGANAERLQADFGERIMPTAPEDVASALVGATLLVNTTSLGMKGQPPLEVNLGGLAREAVVADIVYVPLETALVLQAKARGHPVVPGLGMLLHQAVPGFELWFGRRPEVTLELRDLVARDIDPSWRRP